MARLPRHVTWPVPTPAEPPSACLRNDGLRLMDLYGLPAQPTLGLFLLHPRPTHLLLQVPGGCPFSLGPRPFPSSWSQPLLSLLPVLLWGSSPGPVLRGAMGLFWEYLVRFKVIQRTFLREDLSRLAWPQPSDPSPP